MSEEDFRALAQEIYGTVNGYTGIDIQNILPFERLPRALQEAYIQAAKKAAVFVGKAILRPPGEQEAQR